MRANNFPEFLQSSIQEHEDCNHLNIPAIPGPCLACQRKEDEGKTKRMNDRANAKRTYKRSYKKGRA